MQLPARAQRVPGVQGWMATQCCRLCFPSRQGLTHQVGLECNPEIPVSPEEEH